MITVKLSPRFELYAGNAVKVYILSRASEAGSPTNSLV